MAKPSIYLVNRCQTLDVLLDFFLSDKGSFNKTINEKLLTFLHQIDFWDWEIENLIFSFDNFNERSVAWLGNADANAEAVRIKHGFPIKEHIVSQWKTYQWHPNNETVAPIAELNKVIAKWNKLLDRCVTRLFQDEKVIKAAIDLNAQLVPNLDKYKKNERKL